MLKIQKSTDGNVVVFTLSGRIKAAHLAKLQQLLEAEADDQKIMLDLQEVKLIDRDAVSFLAGCETQGVKITNCPAYIREWIDREAGPHERS